MDVWFRASHWQCATIVGIFGFEECQKYSFQDFSFTKRRFHYCCLDLQSLYQIYDDENSLIISSVKSARRSIDQFVLL